jgi:hypothetical protein
VFRGSSLNLPPFRADSPLREVARAFSSNASAFLTRARLPALPLLTFMILPATSALTNLVVLAVVVVVAPFGTRGF